MCIGQGSTCTAQRILGILCLCYRFGLKGHSDIGATKGHPEVQQVQEKYMVCFSYRLRIGFGYLRNYGCRHECLCSSVAELE